MRKITLFLLLIVTMSFYSIEANAVNVIPKLYLSAKNVTQGATGWTITSAAINNATNDYWKMLNTSVMESPEIDLSGYTLVKVDLNLQSFGTITSHSDDVKIEYWDGSVWTQVGANLHTTSTAGVQSVSLPYTYTNAKIKITAPNATIAVGARVMYVDITGTVAGVVSNPVFSSATGNYTSTQSLEITTPTSGATIYYTTDGSTPDNTKTQYTVPIIISATSTIKAIAYKSGLTTSDVTTATYTFPTEVADIAALRAGTAGFYKITGEVVLTLKSSTRNTKYVQDASGAVVIDDATGKITTVFNLGDGISGLIGTTAMYFGMLQFTPVTDPGTATSTNNTVTPTTIALSELINNPAKLVKVENVTITGSGNFAASTSYNLNASASTIIRTQYADLDYVVNTMAIPTAAQNITGVVLVYNTTAQLIPRSSSDMSIATGLTQPTTSIKIAVIDGQLVFDAKAGESVTVYNGVGQKLISKLALEGRNAMSVTARGVLFVKVGNQTAKVVL